MNIGSSHSKCDFNEDIWNLLCTKLNPTDFRQFERTFWCSWLNYDGGSVPFHWEIGEVKHKRNLVHILLEYLSSYFGNRNVIRFAKTECKMEKVLLCCNLVPVEARKILCTDWLNHVDKSRWVPLKYDDAKDWSGRDVRHLPTKSLLENRVSHDVDRNGMVTDKNDIKWHSVRHEQIDNYFEYNK